MRKDGHNLSRARVLFNVAAGGLLLATALAIALPNFLRNNDNPPCALSLCDCECYPWGQTPEQLGGPPCGINCADQGIVDCQLLEGECVEVIDEERRKEFRFAVNPPIPVAIEPDASIVPSPTRTIEDAEVESRWRAVEVTVSEKGEGGKSFKVEIPLGGETAVNGTPLTVRILGFFPDFAMGADSVTTKSIDDKNPAVKIEVSEDGKAIYTGWSFRDFPDMHPFDDPRYTVQLSNAIPANKVSE